MSPAEFSKLWTEFHFLRPAWLWLLVFAFALLLIARRQQRRARGWAAACDPELLAAQQLSATTSSNAGFYLLALAALLVPIALAGPAWQQLPQPLLQSTAARVIALDISRSMDAADLKPSRLDRVRFRIRDLLRDEPDTRTGLLVFSAQAHRVVPLTDDHDTIRHLLDSLGTGLLPPAAARIAPAMDEALALLQAGGATRGEVLLITDSSPEAAARGAVERVRRAGFRLRVVGVGTAEGAPIPDQDGGWLKDRSGAIVLPALDRDALRELARHGGGRYADLDQLTAEQGALAQSATETDPDAGLKTDLWQDEGRWLILLLLPLAAMGARRGWLATVLLMVGVGSVVPTAQASTWWKTTDQQAHELYLRGDAHAAAERFNDPRWRAAALYEAGQPQAAAKLYGSLESASAEDHYNLGNALARSGDLEAAIAAYDRALSERPDWAQARQNRALVEQLLEQQQASQDGAKDEQPSGGEPAPDSADADPSGDGSEPSSPNTPSNEGETEPSSSEGSASEQASDSHEAQASSAAGDRNPDDPEQGQAPNRTEGERTEQQQQQPAQSTEAMPEDAQMQEQTAAARAQAEDRAADEQAQAMEQWLRRIPDDPGGLLRRRFRWEQERRSQQTGGPARLGQPANEEQNW